MYNVVVGSREEGAKNAIEYELNGNDAYEVVDWVDEVDEWQASLAKHVPSFIVLAAREDVEIGTSAKIMSLTEQVKSGFPNTDVVVASDTSDLGDIQKFYAAGASAVLPLLSGQYVEAFTDILADGEYWHEDYDDLSSKAREKDERHRFITETLEGKTALLSTARLIQQGVSGEELCEFLGVQKPTLYQYRWRLRNHLDLEEKVDLQEYLMAVGRPI